MHRILSFAFLIACAPVASTDSVGDSGEISTDPDDMAQEIATLQAQLADLQTAAEATEARLADAEAQLADADTRLARTWT